MKQEYTVPSVRIVHAESENWIATSQAGSDIVNGALFKYDEEVTIDVETYFNVGWK